MTILERGRDGECRYEYVGTADTAGVWIDILTKMLISKYCLLFVQAFQEKKGNSYSKHP